MHATISVCVSNFFSNSVLTFQEISVLTSFHFNKILNVICPELPKLLHKIVHTYKSMHTIFYQSTTGHNCISPIVVLYVTCWIASQNSNTTYALHSIFYLFKYSTFESNCNATLKLVAPGKWRLGVGLTEWNMWNWFHQYLFCHAAVNKTVR